MTEEELNTAISRKLFVVRVRWLIHAAALTALAGFLLSGLWLLAIPIYLFVSYWLVMFLTEGTLAEEHRSSIGSARRVDAARVAQELKRKLQSGEIEQDDEYFATLERYDLNISKVEAFSEEKVGRFGDVDMHEWVEMHDMTTRKVERFYFEQVAEVSHDGTPLIPHIRGRLTAVVNGIVYSRQVQPA